MSKLLIQESPLTFQPSLAVAIGINEAIVLQQIHYWLSNSKNKGYEQDGYKWVYNTYAEWKETNFPFWSENTIQRIFTNLEEMGLRRLWIKFTTESRSSFFAFFLFS